MNKNYINFPETTTMENLNESIAGNCHGAQVVYKNHVVVTAENFKGYYEAAVYGFDESPENIGLEKIERQLNIVAAAKSPFSDSGSAIAWGLEMLYVINWKI